MKKVLISLIVLNSSGFAFAQEEESGKGAETSTEETSGAPEEKAPAAKEESKRKWDNHGLGFGFGSAPATAGLQVYYDYNLNPREKGFDQIHVFFYSGSADEESLTGSSKVDLQQHRLVVSYRRVWNSGWFIGAGLGAMSGDIDYKYDQTWLNPNEPVVRKKFKFSAAVLMADLGWQGNDGYYFTVGFQPSTFIGFKGEYHETDIPDVANHRMKVSDYWGHAQDDKSLFNIGFGWYIE